MLSGASDITDLLLRGAAAALNLLVAVQFARIRPAAFVAVAGCLFALSIAAYGLASSSMLASVLGRFIEALVVPAVFASVFFWWFALALFRDAFEWRRLYAAPAILLLVFHVLRRAPDDAIRVAGGLLHQVVVVLLLIHVVSLALTEFRNDLVDARRRFRLTIALALPLVGLIIAAAETYRFHDELPDWLSLAQAVMLAVFSFVFALWTTKARADLFARPAIAPQPHVGLLNPAERVELERLKTAIAGGACLEPDQTLGSLARRLNLPEHRLRRLINKGLGYRNFAGFLNDHRVAEAKRRFADPGLAREQVASVAFSLGYASLAPFNRAFRELTGMTPTDYRAQMLARRVDSENP